jgi:hypothetical protein
MFIVREGAPTPTQAELDAAVQRYIDHWKADYESCGWTAEHDDRSWGYRSGKTLATMSKTYPHNICVICDTDFVVKLCNAAANAASPQADMPDPATH